VQHWTEDIYPSQERQRATQAKVFAGQGKGTAEIAKRLGVSTKTVRRWAGKEIDAYRNQLRREVKRLAKQGHTAEAIASAKGMSPRTVYDWASRELKEGVRRRKQ
jgi:transposase